MHGLRVDFLFNKSAFNQYERVNWSTAYFDCVQFCCTLLPSRGVTSSTSMFCSMIYGELMKASCAFIVNEDNAFIRISTYFHSNFSSLSHKEICASFIWNNGIAIERYFGVSLNFSRMQTGFVQIEYFKICITVISQLQFTVTWSSNPKSHARFVCNLLCSLLIIHLTHSSPSLAPSALQTNSPLSLALSSDHKNISILDFPRDCSLTFMLTDE